MSAQPGASLLPPAVPGRALGGLGSGAAGGRAGPPATVRPAQLAAARVLPAAPLVSTPPGSVGRPPARRCRCPSGCPTATPSGGGAAPSGSPTSAPRSHHAPAYPVYWSGIDPKHEGGSAEGCLEAAAWAQGGSCGRSASGGGTGATHLGLASLGSLYAPRAGPQPACNHFPPGAQGLNTMPSTPRASVVARHPTGPLGSRGQPALRFWNSRGWRKGA